MPLDYSIDTQRGMVFSKATGSFRAADALDHMKRLSADANFRPTYNQLIDFREISALELSTDQIRDLASTAIFGPGSKRAFVVSTDLQFGLGRVFSAYRHIEGEKGIMIFREMKDALHWLSLPSEPDFAKAGSPTS
jgi:hypothetical protein